jgi:hypothetical protein
MTQAPPAVFKIPQNPHNQPAAAPREPVGPGNRIRGVLWQLGGGVVLVGESAEDLLPADPLLGEVDWIRWVAVGLS